MGSDDGVKPSISFVDWLRRRRLVKLKRIGCLALVVTALLAVCWLLPSPERLATRTFQPDIQKLPQQCRKKAAAFYECQKSPSKSVLVCHRRWCHSFGHCQPCGGIGDRTRFLLSQVEDATRACRAVKIDAPMADMAWVESAVYEDPAGWLAELLRFRSYSLGDRRAPPRTLTAELPLVYSHFTPNHYALHQYDPCTMHMLLQPAPALQADIDRHNIAIGGPSIGIHFRTGDSSAFGIANKDTRVGQSQVSEGLAKMMACAEELAEKLFPFQQVSYYLATDNPLVKKLAREDASRTIYMTDFEPESYLRGNSGDRNAWMEVYLLGAREALVVNVQPKEYTGPAGRLSYFSALAKHIGFIPNDHVKECVLD